MIHISFLIPQAFPYGPRPIESTGLGRVGRGQIEQQNFQQRVNEIMGKKKQKLLGGQKPFFCCSFSLFFLRGGFVLSFFPTPLLFWIRFMGSFPGQTMFAVLFKTHGFSVYSSSMFFSPYFEDRFFLAVCFSFWKQVGFLVLIWNVLERKIWFIHFLPNVCPQWVLWFLLDLTCVGMSKESTYVLFSF